MKSFFVFVMFIVSFLAIGEAMETAGCRNNKLAIDPNQRFLRTTTTTEDDTATEEERGIQTRVFDKLGRATGNLRMPQKLKFWIWKKGKWDYNRLKEYLFKGAPKSVYEKDPRFAKVLHKYGDYWRKSAMNGHQVRS